MLDVILLLVLPFFSFGLGFVVNRAQVRGYRERWQKANALLQDRGVLGLPEPEPKVTAPKEKKGEAPNDYHRLTDRQRLVLASADFNKGVAIRDDCKDFGGRGGSLGWEVKSDGKEQKFSGKPDELIVMLKEMQTVAVNGTP